MELTSLFWYRRATNTIGRLKILQAVDAVWLGGAPTAVSQPYRRASDTTVPHEIILIRIGGPPIRWSPLILELPSCASSCIGGLPIQWDSSARRCWEAIVHPPIHFLQPPSALPLWYKRVYCTCILTFARSVGLPFTLLGFPQN